MGVLSRNPLPDFLDGVAPIAVQRSNRSNNVPDRRRERQAAASRAIRRPPPPSLLNKIDDDVEGRIRKNRLASVDDNEKGTTLASGNLCSRSRD